LSYYLAIDQGTHASRACLFDETGNMVYESRQNIKLDHISNTEIEQDAEEIVESVRTVLKKLLDETAVLGQIIACGIAIQRSSVIAWTDDGSALSQVLSWQDTRGTEQITGLSVMQSEIHQLSGLPLSAHYGASKMHYLLDRAVSEGVAVDNLRLSPLISYLLFHILEHRPYIVDHTNAQRTQLFDVTEMCWSARLAELFGVPLQVLPDCVSVLNNADVAHGSLAGSGIPVRAIIGDQNAAIFGAGQLTSETALVNFGSGAFVLRFLNACRASEKQLSTIACSENSSVQYVREATINGAGSALNWLAEKHGVDDLSQQLPRWLDEVERPPVFINSIGGLGSPWWSNQIEPEFIDCSTGITVANEITARDRVAHGEVVEDIASQAVAVIESIVFMVCANLDIMKTEQSLSRLRVCGGLSRLDGLCQRLADLSTLVVERMDTPEATARGIAWLAAGKPEGWSCVDLECYEPAADPGLSERYAMFKAALNRHCT